MVLSCFFKSVARFIFDSLPLVLIIKRKVKKEGVLAKYFFNDLRSLFFNGPASWEMVERWRQFNYKI